MSITKQIKDNEKFLQKEVDRIFDSIMDSKLTWQDRVLAERCLFCSGRKTSDLVFDIIAKCYESLCGELPTKAEEIRKCNHMHWPVGTTVEIAAFLTNAIQEGFPDIWAINGNMETVLPFGPIHAITILANVDFAEFVFAKGADEIKSMALEEFHIYYDNHVKKDEYSVGNNQDRTGCDPVTLEEIKKIEEQFFWGPVEKHKDLEEDEKDAIINHFGKNLVSMFERIDAKILVILWQDVEYAHLRRDWAMLYLKKIGKEWIESLKSRPYQFKGFERANEKLRFYQTWQVDPKMQDEWINAKNELLS